MGYFSIFRLFSKTCLASTTTLALGFIEWHWFWWHGFWSQMLQPRYWALNVSSGTYFRWMFYDAEWFNKDTSSLNMLMSRTVVVCFIKLNASTKILVVGKYHTLHHFALCFAKQRRWIKNLKFDTYHVSFPSGFVVQWRYIQMVCRECNEYPSHEHSMYSTWQSNVWRSNMNLSRDIFMGCFN